MIAGLVRRVVPERLRPKGYLTHLVRERTKDAVMLGPFAGMRYLDHSIGSAYLPKLLGTYERELTPAIETVCARRPILILILGAAEGYYAIGLALRNPQARVIAFERENEGRQALLKMAVLNGVENRMEIRGECGPAELSSALQMPPGGPAARAGQRPFIVCDVEGDEHRLLRLEDVPGLRRSSLLIETHDFIRAGITDVLRRRFSGSHRIETIWQQERSIEDFPFRDASTVLVPESYLAWAVSEWRPTRMCWLWMQPFE